MIRKPNRRLHRLLRAIPKIDVTDRLGAIKCPVQIIVGDQDVGTPVAMSRAIQDAIPGPNS